MDLAVKLCPRLSGIVLRIRVQPHVDFVVLILVVDEAHFGEVEGQGEAMFLALRGFVVGVRFEREHRIGVCRLRIDRQNPVIILRSRRDYRGADPVSQGSAILVFDFGEGDGVGSAAGVRHDQVVVLRHVAVEDRDFLRKACCAIAGRARDLEVRELRGVLLDGDFDRDAAYCLTIDLGRHGRSQLDFLFTFKVLCCVRAKLDLDSTITVACCVRDRNGIVSDFFAVQLDLAQCILRDS